MKWLYFICTVLNTGNQQVRMKIKSGSTPNQKTPSKILCKWKQVSVVRFSLYLDSVFKNKHKWFIINPQFEIGIVHFFSLMETFYHEENLKYSQTIMLLLINVHQS